MSINHIATRPFRHADQNALEDAEVSSRHCKEHDYSERCSRDKVIAAIDAIREEEERLKLEEENVTLMEQEIASAELADCHIFVEKANSRLLIIEASLRCIARDALNLTHEAIEIEEFIVGGS